MNQIKVDLDRTLSRIDGNISVGFVEHLDRRIYGGFCDSKSPLAVDRFQTG